jgi:hypothetical protein
MRYKKYHLLAVFFLALLPAGVVFAHGGEEESAVLRHPETQIGLSGSVVGEDALATSSGMTREEVAALIEEIQAPEETRSLMKLTLLALAIAGLIQLYSPQKQAPLPETSGGMQS